jgi:hypothetical protein
MAHRKSTERERIEAAAISGRHPDTVGRFGGGLNVTSQTRAAIEAACRVLGYEHIIEERERNLRKREGQ